VCADSHKQRSIIKADKKQKTFCRPFSFLIFRSEQNPARLPVFIPRNKMYQEIHHKRIRETCYYTFAPQHMTNSTMENNRKRNNKKKIFARIHLRDDVNLTYCVPPSSKFPISILFFPAGYRSQSDERENQREKSWK
jgi:hypothetical protein